MEGACGTFGPNLNEVVQITVIIADSVVLGDTLRGHATAANARGDTVPATVVWTSFDTTIIAVADSNAGVFVGRKAGTTTSVQARIDNLRSNPVPIRVTALTTP
jgi:hypothetical protein